MWLICDGRYNIWWLQGYENKTLKLTSWIHIVIIQLQWNDEWSCANTHFIVCSNCFVFWLKQHSSSILAQFWITSDRDILSLSHSQCRLSVELLYRESTQIERVEIERKLDKDSRDGEGDGDSPEAAIPRLLVLNTPSTFAALVFVILLNTKILWRELVE